jgi:hypothetical protein
MDEGKKELELSQKSKALVSGIDVLRNTELVKPEDFEFLKDHVENFEKRFKTRALYRSKTEMLAGVLNDAEHPTPDSKYWQAIGEQNVQLTELINLSYESKKTEADNELMMAEIEELEDKISKETNEIKIKKLEAKLKKKRVELAQSQFGMTQQAKTAQERLREIKTWEPIIQELEKQLEFGDEDFELHHPKRYYLRYENRMKNLQMLEPAAKESVVNHFQAFSKLINENEALMKPNIPPGLPGSASEQAESLEKASNDDPVVKKYFDHKVRKILVVAPHRRKEDGNVTNFNLMQVPAGFSASLFEPYGYLVADAQNYAVKKALDEGYDYIFFVEDDNLIPRNALVQLMKHKANIVGGFYYRKYLPLESTGMHYNENGEPTSIDDYKIGDIIHNTLVLPMGCTLIKTEVFKDMEYPWYKEVKVSGRPTLTSDTYICEKLRLKDIDVITDTGVQCLHIDREKGIIYGHPEIVDYDNNTVRENWREYFAV